MKKPELEKLINEFLNDRNLKADQNKEQRDTDSPPTVEAKMHFNLAIKEEFLDRFKLLKIRYQQPLKKIAKSPIPFNPDKEEEALFDDYLAAAFTPDGMDSFSDFNIGHHNISLLNDDVIQRFLEEE